MKLTVNGKVAAYTDGLSVTELLQVEKVKMPDMVSVELNGSILRREHYVGTVLQDNDQIEFLYFMGGGNAADGISN